MNTAEATRRGVVGGPALTANTDAPTTSTQTRKERSVGKTR
jgi:hypothetical protein